MPDPLPRRIQFVQRHLQQPLGNVRGGAHQVLKRLLAEAAHHQVGRRGHVEGRCRPARAAHEIRREEKPDHLAATVLKAIAERVKNIHLADKSKVFNTARIEALEVENLIEAARATIVSAAARHESRGAHTVDDYADSPEFPLGRNDAEWMKHTLWYSQGDRLEYKPVKLQPLTVDSVPPKVRTF